MASSPKGYEGTIARPFAGVKYDGGGKMGHFYDKVITGPVQSEGARWDVFVSHIASRGITYQVRDAVSFVTAPSIDSFLGVNDFHFNTDVSHLDEIVLGEMKQYLERYVVHNVLKIDVGHKLIVIEK
jgi:hypothetical protein